MKRTLFLSTLLLAGMLANAQSKYYLSFQAESLVLNNTYGGVDCDDFPSSVTVNSLWKFNDNLVVGNSLDLDSNTGILFHWGLADVAHQGPCFGNANYTYNVSELQFGVLSTYDLSASGIGNGVIEAGISPPRPISVKVNKGVPIVTSDLEGETVTLGLDYVPGDYANNPVTNFTYEIQYSINGQPWISVPNGSELGLNASTPFDLPNAPAGLTSYTLYFRSRVHRINGVAPVSYSRWSQSNFITVHKTPVINISPASGGCTSSYGASKAITFSISPFGSSIEPLDIMDNYTDTHGSTANIAILQGVTGIGGSFLVSLGAGTHGFSIRANSNYDKDIDPTPYLINAPPAAPVFSSGPTSPCAGSTQTYSVNGVAGVTYSWAFPSGWEQTYINPEKTSVTVKVGSTGSITVTPSNSCPTTTPKVLTIPVNVSPLPPAAIAVAEASGVTSNDRVTCSGAEATLTASGGSSYSWTGIGTSNPITVNPASSTTYTVTVTSSNGCSNSASTTITVNPLPTASISAAETSGVSSNDGITCSGAGVTLTASGGFAYSWTGIGTSNPITVNPTSSSTYTVTVTDGNSCSSAASTTITVNAIPAITGTTGGSRCGAGAVTLGATASAGAINWYSGITGGGSLRTDPSYTTPSVSSTTSYFVDATANGCTSPLRSEVVATIHPLPNSTFTLGDPTICNGQSATITQSGSELGFSYQLQLVATSDNAGDPVTGTGSSISYPVDPASTTSYKVTATNSTTSCSVTLTDQATVTVNPLPTPTLTGSAIACAEVPGNVYATEPNMTGYLWSVSGGEFASGITPTGNTASITWYSGGTGAGKGYVSVSYTNANLCSAASFTVKEVSITSLSLTQPATTDIGCHGDNTGAISIGASGGATPYTYILKRGNESVDTASDGNFTGLAAAPDYTVTATDINACSVTSGEIPIGEPPAIVVAPNSITHVSCYGSSTGAIALTVTGGTNPLAYRWSSPSGFSSVAKNISGLKADAYTLVVTDGNGCTATFTVAISQPAAPLTLGTPSVINIVCNGSLAGKITITASGGTPPYSYALTGGGITPITTTDGVFEGLPAADNYSIAVTDNNLCTATADNIAITQPPELYKLSIKSSKSITCPGGSDGWVVLEVAGGTPGYEFSRDGSIWMSLLPPYTFDNLAYSAEPFRVKDSEGCIAEADNTITQPDPIVPTALTTHVSCKGGSNGKLSFTVSGGTGLYSLRLAGEKSFSQTIVDVAQAAEFVGLKADRYNLTVTDASGCERSEGYDVLEPLSPLSLAVTSKADPSCSSGTNGEVKLEATGGWGRVSYTYSLEAPSVTSPDGQFAGLGDGTYRFTVADSLRCVANASATLNEPDPLVLSSTVKHLDCQGDGSGSIMVAAAGGTAGYSYTLTGGGITPKTIAGGTFSNLPAADGYWVKATDRHGCADSLQAKVTEPSTLKLTLSNTRDDGLSVNCTGGKDSVWVTPHGGTAPYTVALLGQAHSCPPSGYTLRGLANGRYPVKITDSHGCKDSSTAVISNLPGPRIKLISVADANCSYSADGSIAVKPSSVTGYVSVSWDNRARFGDVISNLPGGQYTARATDLYGCTHDTTITVGRPDSIIVSLGKKRNPHCFAYSDGVLGVTVSQGVAPYAYLWSNGSQVDSTGAAPSGLYTLRVTDSKGCIANASYRLVDPPTVKPNLLERKTICSNQTYEADAGMPNAASYLWFSANGFSFRDRVATLSAAGDYYLLVTDANGCTGKDTLTLVKDGGIIDANFIMTERASVGDTIVIIEMSWPIPEAIEWVYPAAFREVFKTDYSVYLVPQMVGTFTIGLNSYLGTCSAYIDKPITIGHENPESKGNTTKQALIREVAVFPNPSKGDFSVAIELNKECEATVEVYSVHGNRLLSRKVSGQTEYRVDVNLLQLPGIYLVRVVAGGESRSLRVVVE